jgi:aspartate aminotransferase
MERAASRRREGRTIIDLAQGEVDDRFTPDHVKEAASRALRDNRTKYTPTSGIPELREAIALRFERDNGLTVSPAHVMASTGAKQCVYHFMLAALNPGDEVLVPAPYWVSYLNQVTLVGARPVVVPTSAATGFKVSADQLRTFITPATRALVLNNPNNPSGAVYTRSELLDILEVVRAAELVVVADEVYDRLTYDGAEHVSFATLTPEAAAVTVTVNAVSKSYCMTGWRLGFAAGPAELIAAMQRMQSHITSAPNSIAQWAAVAALTGDQSDVGALNLELAKRRRFVVDALRELPGIECFIPQGAFYVFPRIASPLDPARFATELLEATDVMVVPGAAFGMPEHMRLCFGASWDALQLAMERIGAWLEPVGQGQGTSGSAIGGQ